MATDTAAIELRKIGIFGGAFDPVHPAHIAVAQAARAQFQLEKVILVPSGNPPHRNLSSTSDLHRVAMLELAVAGSPDLVVDDWELHQDVTTYTYDTLRHLCQTKSVEYFFLMGEDSLQQFTSWRNWEGILELCHLCVARRSGDSFSDLPDEIRRRIADVGSCGNSGSNAGGGNRVGNIYFIDFEEMPISATGIRQQLMNGNEPHGLLDPAVTQYIRENRLYQNG